MPSSLRPSSALNPGAIRTLLDEVWQSGLPLLSERLAVLDAATAAAHSGNCTGDLRAQAIAEAHKLSGSLGMFGYPEGTNLAREIEALLDAPGLPPAARLTELTAALRETLSLTKVL